jgi:isoleucyl-tRNA synthetase
LTVGPKIDYVLVKTFNQYTFEPINIVLAKPLVGKQFGKKFVEGTMKILPIILPKKTIPYQILAEFKGADLVGIKYEQLLDYAKPYQNPENALE